MKTKGLPQNWFERLVPDKNLRDLLRFMFVFIGGTVLVAVLIVAILYKLFPISTPTEIYQAVYNDCIAYEDMTKELCHEIALEKVGD